MDGLLETSVIDGPLVVGLSTAGALALLASLWRPSRRWSRGRWSLTVLGATAGGALLGWLGGWLAFDVLDAFGVSPTTVTRSWIAAGGAAIALALVGLIRARPWRIVVGAIALVLAVAVPAMWINIDFGEYPTIASVLRISRFHGHRLPTLAQPATRPSIAEWTAPAGLATAGAVSEVEIPATVSGFPARPAVVYLPPAALADDAPLLPVWIVLSGQPGSPEDPLTAAGLLARLDAYAAAHQGLAPIVVAADQLGSPDANPMCVDGPLGNSASYLTVDVVHWIETRLPATTDHARWAIGGMSQGGTCASQLGPAHPDLFGGFVDASGELVPSVGSVDDTVARGFDGDRSAYLAATPLAILAANAPLTGMIAVLGVGEQDTRFRDGIEQLAAAAQAAGATTTLAVWPNTAHDATAWGLTLGRGLDVLGAAWGLDR
ncbi:MAG: hypothetical protein BGO95_06020 [Micrococcales bacterium 73-13]|nr:MAG: hypothetical protein BGO95_06020 [Micrococcales bacterium 73-13]